VEARGHLAVGADAQRADEWRDRPRQPFAEVQHTVHRRAARAGRVLENLRRVLAGAVGIARRLAQRAAPRADGDPRTRLGANLLHCRRQVVAALGPLNEARAADRVGQRWNAVEAWPLAGDGLVLRRAEVAGRGVPGLDLEGFAGPDAQLRFVAPVEGKLAG